MVIGISIYLDLWSGREIIYQHIGISMFHHIHGLFFFGMLSRPRQSYIHHRIHLTSGVPYGYHYSHHYLNVSYIS